MPLVTISRSIGCGGKIIARLVAEGLNLQLYDDPELQAEALKMGIRSEDLKSLNEKAPGLFDRIMTRRPQIYLDLMEAVVYEVAQRGEGVILGHGSQLMLRDFGCALHVLVHAGESTRIQNIMEQRGLSQEAARKLIHRRDHEQKGFFRYPFQMDWNDPSLYDLIINTEKMGIDAAAKLIMEAAQSDQVKTCSLTATEAMERLSQAKRIEAALLKNDLNLSMLNVEVPETGVAQISGWSYTEDERERIAEIVKGVPGISEVRSEVAIMPASV
jgi:cytidylate kinase